MKIHSVKLENYKSIGNDAFSEIVIEPTVTTIIGKNESGKSNILTGLSGISFLQKVTTAFNDDYRNRNHSDCPIRFTITLKGTPTESMPGDTLVTLTADSFSATGGILKYYVDDIQRDVESLADKADQNPFGFKNNDLATMKKIVANLRQTDSLDIPKMDQSLRQLSTWTKNIPIDNRTDYAVIVEVVDSKWKKLTAMLPIVFFRRDSKILASEYKGDSIKKELEDPKSMLSELMAYLNFTKEQVLEAVSNKTTGSIQDIRDKIQEAIDNKINAPFHDFYSNECINLKIRFQPNTILFSVKSDGGATMTLDERSNGLRWYLNMFIDATMHNLPNKNVVYLFDEPGISLHVNAQRELLKLFSDLASKGNQVVYTTHSPYMLNLDDQGVERIRAVVKNAQGTTDIFKTAYDARISSEHQQDTLTPLIEAMGMNLQTTFGPSLNKFNVVTEGMSDLVYLRAFGKILGEDLESFAFIPVVGASNCIHVSNILHGWGCKYMTLFDYDYEGVVKGGEKFRNDYGRVCNVNYMYLADATADDIAQKTYSISACEIEQLVPDLTDFLSLRGYGTEGKVLTAKLYANAIEDGSYECPAGTLENFRILFERIQRCKLSQ